MSIFIYHQYQLASHKHPLSHVGLPTIYLTDSQNKHHLCRHTKDITAYQNHMAEHRSNNISTIRDTHRHSRWFFSCGPKGLAYQLRLPALVQFTLANYFPLPVNGSSKFSVSCSLISSSSNWFCIYFRIFLSFFPTVLT